jgi:ADP-ribosylglycohydrolase
MIEGDVTGRARGALLGLACGDALGTTLEFRPPGSFRPITDLVGGGPFGLRAGEWTDDTSMALCLAESLIECRGFDATDQLRRYLRWYREGHLGVDGTCVDIGTQTLGFLTEFERTGAPDSTRVDPEQAGNGSIMRLAPVPIAYRRDIRVAIEHSGGSSRTTHPAPRPVDACRYLGALTVGALVGAEKDDLLDDGFWSWGRLHPEIEAVVRGSYKHKEPPEIAGTGYVVASLEAALWALHKGENFRDGALLAVNLGNDADTTGAVYGQIAGALHGEEGIPAGWRQKLAHQDLIRGFADDLLGLNL